MTELGTAHFYAVELRTRGGRQRVATLTDITEVSWGRVLNETSEATITALPRGSTSQSILDDVERWAHEIAVWRDGILVWEGPVWDINDDGAAVTIIARDVTAWLIKRIVHNEYDTEGETVDVVTLAHNMLLDAYGPDDPDVLAYLWLKPSGTAVERYVEGHTVMAAADLDSLTELGLDWTVKNRRILLFGREPLAELHPLRGEHFVAPLPIAKVGSVIITRAVVQGGGVQAEAGGVHPVLGLLEELIEVSDLDSDEDAAVRAQAALYTPNLLINSSVALTPRAPVTIDDLIPGVATSVSGRGCALEVTDAHMQLTKLSVTWTPAGETVTPTFVEVTDRSNLPTVEAP